MDYQTVIIPKEHLERYMKDFEVESRATAMEQMRDKMYEYLAKRSNCPLNSIKDIVTIKFEI